MPEAEQPKKSVTLRDIAVETGFSINTVSHALKDKPDISAATKNLIRQAAERLGYIVNISASSLRSGRSRTVAIILGDISNPHFAISVKQIEADIRKLGYTAIILNTDEDPILERKAIITALSQKVDGMIICPTQNSPDNLHFLQKSGIPFVLLGRHFPDLQLNSVIADDWQGGLLATAHLLEQGHRRILFLNGPIYISSAADRLAGYRQALRDHQAEEDPSLIQTISITAGKNIEQMRRILLDRQDYSAVLAFSDLIALEVIDILSAAGRRIPEDVSVIGFDNIQSQFIMPTHLTSVSTAKSTMASKVVEILFNQINRTADAAQTIQVVLPARLVKRQSTQAIS
jgi:LacI family transcriptional regulator